MWEGSKHTSTRNITLCHYKPLLHYLFVQLNENVNILQKNSPYNKDLFTYNAVAWEFLVPCFYLTSTKGN